MPPAPARFSITMGWPSSAARRSNTSRGTTSAALPAPNGIVALIRCAGQSSAWAGVVKRAASRQMTEMWRHELTHAGTCLVGPAIVARTIPVSPHSTSVNCSSSVRWSIEKLSSETSVSTVSPSASHARRCLPYCRSPAPDPHRRSRDHRRRRRARPVPAESCGYGCRRPASQENFRSRIRRSPDGSSTASLMSKSSVRRTANCPGEGPPTRKAIEIALRIEAALGERDQRAGERLALRHKDQAFEALVVTAASSLPAASSPPRRERA